MTKEEARDLAEIVVELHCIFDDYDKIAFWLTTKNRNLGGASPMRLIQLGRIKKVLQFILDRNDRD